MVENRPRLYGRFSQPKKKGGERIITPPCKELRIIQYRVKEYLEERIQWPRYLHGGICGRSIITNARSHVGQEVVANFDIKDFFPSTSDDRVMQILQEGGMGSEAARLMSCLCCYEDRLPQGAPTSTCLANLSFVPIDTALMGIVRKHRFTYTRFVDDLTLSGKETLRSFKGVVGQMIRSGGYAMSKEVLIGRDKPQIVTGLVVNDKMRPDTKFIQRLKDDIRDCWSEGLGLEVVAAYYGVTIGQLKYRFFGQINHIRQFNRKLAREIRGLMIKIA